ncbi:sulfite exporter TauE/SafE family protein [Mariprofundus ferrooxydans]|uniref:sulfite exporter TauE/SafE family protein n=1 Tax=Mariprofundus ferrooxydans TaxID=314344 RepID=UPI0003817550|nr:sulfite exporter TauE/SafE family protein [Mariprofundus ferrooxydans]
MSFGLIPAALLIGLILGLFGAGGGMLTVPALMMVGDMSVKEAVPMSLWVVSLVSLTAAIHQQVWKQLQYRLLIILGATGIAGSAIGARIGAGMSESLQLAILAILILTVAVWTGFVRLENKVSTFRYIPAVLAGFAIGLLTGMLGVGGGFLLVPALIFLGIGHFPTAVGHSLMIIIANAAGGIISYSTVESVHIDIGLTLSVALIAAVGSIIGGILLKRLPAARLQKGFAILLIFLGGFIAWQSLSVT